MRVPATNDDPISISLFHQQSPATSPVLSIIGEPAAITIKRLAATSLYSPASNQSPSPATNFQPAHPRLFGEAAANHYPASQIAEPVSQGFSSRQIDDLPFQPPLHLWPVKNMLELPSMVKY